MKTVLFLVTLCVLCLARPRALAASPSETLLFVSDLHWDHRGAPDTVLPLIRRAAQGADALIFLGDNTNNGRPEEHEAFLAWLGSLAGELSAELIVLPGNHDISARYPAERFRADYAPFGPDRAFALDGSSGSFAQRTRGGTVLLMLDLNTPGPIGGADINGAVSDSLLRWVRQTLAACPGETVIACAHYPLQPLLSETVEGREKLLALLADSGVPVYLCGHRHINETWISAGLRQITVGVPTVYPFCLGQLTAGDGSLSYQVLPLYDPDDPALAALRQEAWLFGQNMARGSLRDTPLSGDEKAENWFADVYLAYAEGRLPEMREELLRDPSCEAWRNVTVRQVTRAWILGLLDQPRESWRNIRIR